MSISNRLALCSNMSWNRPFAPPSRPRLASSGEPIYTNDIVATQNRIDIKVHQVTLVGTYGLSDKLDVSIALPIVNVRVGMTSNANIYQLRATAGEPHVCAHYQIIHVKPTSAPSTQF